MNTATNWREQVINDTTVRYVSEHTVGGSLAVTATVQDGALVWDKPNDVPYLLVERATRALRV
jgi:hypothetical protein